MMGQHAEHSEKGSLSAGWPNMHSALSDLFKISKLIQIWNSQKMAFYYSKFSNKISIRRELNKEQLFLLEHFKIQNIIWIKN
jgi:hypothetical protein